MMEFLTRHFYLLGMAVLCFALLGSSCSTKEEQQETITKPFSIVATTGMIGDAIKQIAKDKATIEVFMGPGVDPHLYKPTPSNLSALRNADAIFYNGLHLESKMVEVLEKMKKSNEMIFAAEEAVQETDLKYPGGETLPDPHIWFNLSLWQKVVLHVGKSLAKLDTANADFYVENASSYYQELETLNNYVQEQIGSIPKEQRILVTAHDAFGYFGEAYDIEVEGLQGISTMAEFGLQDVAAMVALITERNIKAVFVETAISDRSIKAVVEGCKEKGHQVVIGGTLYADALGAKGTPEEFFVGVVKHNVNTITSALK